jgi:hypothetical protein
MTEPTLTPEYIAQVNAQLEAQSAQVVLEKFRTSRQSQLDNAVVTTSAGNKYDANEVSIMRLTIAVTAAVAQDETYIIEWSLADTGTGVMTEVTLADLREAQGLAAQNMANIWSIT